ncbi:hypothetical protein ON010_g15927 [Phytophthora cinnamomi]|nr:hypothetical protein ON010_g15927 [Phytophthora cinnamomi]
MGEYVMTIASLTRLREAEECGYDSTTEASASSVGTHFSDLGTSTISPPLAQPSGHSFVLDGNSQASEDASAMQSTCPLALAQDTATPSSLSESQTVAIAHRARHPGATDVGVDISSREAEHEEASYQSDTTFEQEDRGFDAT